MRISIHLIFQSDLSWFCFRQDGWFKITWWSMTQGMKHIVEGSLFQLYVGYKWVFANVNMIDGKFWGENNCVGIKSPLRYVILNNALLSLFWWFVLPSTYYSNLQQSLQSLWTILQYRSKNAIVVQPLKHSRLHISFSGISNINVENLCYVAKQTLLTWKSIVWCELCYHIFFVWNFLSQGDHIWQVNSTYEQGFHPGGN